MGQGKVGGQGGAGRLEPTTPPTLIKAKGVPEQLRLPWRVCREEEIIQEVHTTYTASSNVSYFGLLFRVHDLVLSHTLGFLPFKGCVVATVRGEQLAI